MKQTAENRKGGMESRAERRGADGWGGRRRGLRWRRLWSLSEMTDRQPRLWAALAGSLWNRVSVILTAQRCQGGAAHTISLKCYKFRDNCRQN